MNQNEVIERTLRQALGEDLVPYPDEWIAINEKRFNICGLAAMISADLNQAREFGGIM